MNGKTPPTYTELALMAARLKEHAARFSASQDELATRYDYQTALEQQLYRAVCRVAGIPPERWGRHSRAEMEEFDRAHDAPDRRSTPAA